jgi:hypothetical protein
MSLTGAFRNHGLFHVEQPMASVLLPLVAKAFQKTLQPIRCVSDEDAEHGAVAKCATLGVADLGDHRPPSAR